MKNTLAKIVSAFAVVAIFSAFMTFIGVWLFRSQSVSPTFPYYYSLLTYVKDAAYVLWGYFDGVHYLRLIENGYVDTGTQAFFPLYPLLVRVFSNLSGLNAYISGVIISLFALSASLLVLWQLYPTRKFVQTSALLFFPLVFFS